MFERVETIGTPSTGEPVSGPGGLVSETVR